LRGVSLDPRTELKTGRQLSGGVEVELMLAVAVGKRVVLAEVETIEIAEGEWVAFVGIVVQVFREHVVSFQLHSVTHPLSNSNRHAAIERMGGALSIRNRTEISERRGSRVNHSVAVCGNGDGGTGVGIDETGQIDAFRPGGIEIARPVRSQLPGKAKV